MRSAWQSPVDGAADTPQQASAAAMLESLECLDRLSERSPGEVGAIPVEPIRVHLADTLPTAARNRPGRQSVNPRPEPGTQSTARPSNVRTQPRSTNAPPPNHRPEPNREASSSVHRRNHQSPRALPPPHRRPSPPPRRDEPTNDWRRTAVVYQVYPRSFADSNGDGIGDLPGITGRLDALAELGVDAVWLSPFYKSPQADAGYDVADYRDVDPIFGTLADFDALLEKAHSLGLKVIVDLVPNHSSDEHVWFKAALAAAPGSPERARYIFRDGRGENGELPPNNWESCFRGPAWTRTTNPDGTPGQWYLHLFDTKQPDWDWENPEVRAEFLSVLTFWLDRGADGFRVDVAHSLIKAPGLPDLDPRVDDGLEVDTEGLFMTGPMWDQDRVHEVYQSWRALLDSYTPDRILVAEAWVQPLSRLANYVRPDEMHQAFNFDYLETGWDAAELRRTIDASMAANQLVGAPTTWVLSNHDVVRHVSRLGLDTDGPRPNGIRAGDAQPDYQLGLRRAKASSLLMLGLPGSAYLYQGEELGLPDHTSLDDDLRQDPTWWRSEYTEAGRDGCRVPLPWEADAPGSGLRPEREDLAAAAGLLRGTRPRPAGRGRGLHAGHVPVRAGAAPGVQARRRIAGVDRRSRRRRRGVHQRRGHGDRQHGRPAGSAARQRGADGLRRSDRRRPAAGGCHRLAGRAVRGLSPTVRLTGPDWSDPTRSAANRRSRLHCNDRRAGAGLRSLTEPGPSNALRSLYPPAPAISRSVARWAFQAARPFSLKLSQVRGRLPTKPFLTLTISACSRMVICLLSTESLTWIWSRSVPKSIDSVAASAAAIENRTGWCRVSDSRYRGCCASAPASGFTTWPRSRLR